MALRSTKDLKNIVNKQRAQSKMNGIAGQDFNTSGGSTTGEDEGNYEVQKKWDQKFGVDSVGDKDQQKDYKAVMYKLEMERDDFKQKYQQMQRQFHSMSNTAHSDKSEFAKIKAMKDKYEKTIKELEARNQQLKEENELQKPLIVQQEQQIKQWPPKYDAKCKELEKALADLKKQEKTSESRMAGITKSNAGLHEANQKLKSEIQHLKLSVKEKQIQIDELVAQIKLMADADKQMSEMKAVILEKDRTILALRAQLDAALQAQRDLTEKYGNFESEIQRMQMKYEEALELSINLQAQIRQLEATNKSVNLELTESRKQTEQQVLENQELEKKIEELQRTIDMLRNDSSASNGELVDKIRALENDNSGLNSKLKMVTNQLSQLKGEHETIKSEKRDLQKDLVESQERETKLEEEIKPLKEENKKLETQLFEHRTEFKEFQRQFEILRTVELTYCEKLKKLTEHQLAAEERNKELQVKVNEFDKMRLEIQRILSKQVKPTEDLDSTLSCLSCLEYLKDPQTLVCGHSICRKCFTTHSDPNSKDSLVFCEECKVESKNKMIKEQQVMSLICERYGTTRNNLIKIKEMVEAK